MKLAIREIIFQHKINWINGPCCGWDFVLSYWPLRGHAAELFVENQVWISPTGFLHLTTQRNVHHFTQVPVIVKVSKCHWDYIPSEAVKGPLCLRTRLALNVARGIYLLRITCLPARLCMKRTTETYIILSSEPFLIGLGLSLTKMKSTARRTVVSVPWFFFMCFRIKIIFVVTFQRHVMGEEDSILQCIHIVTCGFDTWAEGQHSHLHHNMAKWNLYSCKPIMPKNVLASLALQISCCSAALYIVKLGLKCWKLHWHTSQQSPKCSDAVWAPQSLDSDQSDRAICASVKVSDYYTDSSSWICLWLTTVSSNPDSLNQNKHLGSILSCWKPLIVNSQSTLSRSLNSGLIHCF